MNDIAEDLRYLGLENFLQSWFGEETDPIQGQAIAKARIEELLLLIDQKSNSKNCCCPICITIFNQRGVSNVQYAKTLQNASYDRRPGTQD